MLIGAAYVRLGQIERGLRTLDDVMRETREIHPTIRAELALNAGIARYHLTEYDAADALLASVSSDADIVHVRALEYRGWLALARDHFIVAGEAFRSALQRLDACRCRDRFVEANVLQGVASVVSERLEIKEWRMLRTRLAAFDWSASGLARPHFWTLIFASTMAEISGDCDEAREWVRQAERLLARPAIAPSRIAGRRRFSDRSFKGIIRRASLAISFSITS